MSMTPEFLRSEAARFREMAEAADREASRQRLLAMAADYEARAKVADATQPPRPAPMPEPELEPEPVVSDEATEAKPERRRPGGRTLRLSR
jgi:hypothetical protein